MAYLIWDWRGDPAQIERFFALRLGGCSLIALLHVSTYWSGFATFAALFTGTVSAACGFTVIAIISLRPPGFVGGVEGLLLVMLFTAAAFRLTTRTAAATFAAIVGGANLAMAYESLGARELFDNNVHLFAGVALGLMFTDLNNWRSRHAFALQSRLTVALGELQTQRLRRTQWLEGLAGFLRHEIKNQLVAISSSISLAERAAGHTAASFLERGRRSVLLIQRLVQSATEASTIEAALAVEERRPLPMRKLIGDRLTTFSTSTDRRVIFLSDSSPGWVLGSDLRLIQMLDKLLSNALEHSPSASTIEVELRCSEQHVELTITNDGALPADSSLLFGPFYRGELGSAEHQGLGLFVARAIVIAHEGSIEAHSRGGRVVLAVRLPATSCSYEAATADTQVHALTTPSGKCQETRSLALDHSA